MIEVAGKFNENKIIMIYFFLDTLKKSVLVAYCFNYISKLVRAKQDNTHTKMEIEYEEKVKGEAPADKEADT